MNRLVDATSPYLQQHADNPVDWWEWSAEALAEAKRLDRPILLSVGYAACRHVSGAVACLQDFPAMAGLSRKWFAALCDRKFGSK